MLPFWPIPRGRRERYTIVAASWWARYVVGWVLWTRVVTRGEMGLEAGEGAIMLCNHRSWLDPLLLLGWSRSNGLSKDAIARIPFIGLFGWLAGAVFFDRRSREDRARARDEVLFLVKNGHRIQVFPEGTRTRDGKLRKRVFLALVRDAYNAGVAVSPCAVKNTERTLPPGTSMAFPGHTVELEFGEPLRPKDYPNEESYAIEAWNRVKRMLGE